MTTMHHGWGAFRWPAILTGDETSAGTLDTGLAAISGLVAQAIRSELSTAWAMVCSTLPESNPLHNDGNDPVGSILPVEPSPQNLTAIQLRFPILAVYRTGEPESVMLTTEYPASAQEFVVDWILGPQVVDNQHRIGKFSQLVAQIIRTAIHLGRHPDYLSNANPFWGKFVEVKVIGQQGPGVMQILGADQGAGYWGVSVRLSCTERLVFDHGGSEFEARNYVPAGTGWAQDFEEAEVDTILDNDSIDRSN